MHLHEYSRRLHPANIFLFVYRLVYVQKFSQFTRLLEANMLPVQQTCQKQGDGYGCAYFISSLLVARLLDTV